MQDLDPSAVSAYFERSRMTPFKVITAGDKSSPDIIPVIQQLAGLAEPGFRDAEKVILPDDRHETGQLEARLYPYVRICRIVARGPAGVSCLGTGWFAGPRTIVTAGHVLYDTHWPGWDDRTPAWAEAADVWIGYYRGSSIGHAFSSNFRVAGPWKKFLDTGGAEDERRDQVDLGCIQLGEALSDLPRYFKLDVAPDVVLRDQVASISGFPIDRGAGEVQFSGSERIGEVRPNSFYHAVDTGNGQSGAPVWLGDRNVLQPAIVGVHTGGNLEEGRNWAVRMTDDVAALIRGWVAENA